MQPKESVPPWRSDEYRHWLHDRPRPSTDAEGMDRAPRAVQVHATPPPSPCEAARAMLSNAAAAAACSLLARRRSAAQRARRGSRLRGHGTRIEDLRCCTGALRRVRVPGVPVGPLVVCGACSQLQTPIDHVCIHVSAYARICCTETCEGMHIRKAGRLPPQRPSDMYSVRRSTLAPHANGPAGLSQTREQKSAGRRPPHSAPTRRRGRSISATLAR